MIRLWQVRREQRINNFLAEHERAAPKTCGHGRNAAYPHLGCEARLGQFFTQWFDTAYPSGGGTSRPAITGPGLAGPGFYTSSCRA